MVVASGRARALWRGCWQHVDLHNSLGRAAERLSATRRVFGDRTAALRNARHQTGVDLRGQEGLGSPHSHPTELRRVVNGDWSTGLHRLGFGSQYGRESVPCHCVPLLLLLLLLRL